MASGIKMDAECKDIFTKIKDKKQHGYAIMMINTQKTGIVLEATGLKLKDRQVSTTQESFDEMKAIVLKSEEPRYILADVTYDREGAGKKDVVVYIYWCPDCVPVGKKMVYAASNRALKVTFTGIKQLECHDDDEFSYDSIVAQLKQSDRA